MKKTFLTLVTLIFALTSMAIQHSSTNLNGLSVRYQEYDAELFVTFSTAFQDYMQPENLIQYYPLNKYCGWLPCTVEYSDRWGNYKQFYKYDSSGNILEYSSGSNSSEVNSKYEYSYDENGHIILEVHSSSDGYGHTYEYKYNPDGYVCQKLETFYKNDGYTTTRIYDYTYDDLIKNYLIKEVRTELSYSTTSPEIEILEKRILRNTAGNIIKIENYQYYGDDDVNNIEPYHYVEIEYDQDNIARNIKDITIDPYSKDRTMNVEYSDIDWYCTDGQIVFEIIEPYIHEEFLEGPSLTTSYLGYIFWTKLDFNNLIKSATITNYELKDVPNKFLYEFTYPDYFGSYTCNISYDDQLLKSEAFGILDSFGSEMTDTHYYMRYDRNVEKFVPYEYIKYEEYNADRFGLGSFFRKEGTPEDLIETYDNREITYYEANMPPYYCPIELPHEYFTDGSNWIFSDYIGTVTSVNTIVDTENTIRYYTIEGNPVNGVRLAPGIYIRVKGNKSETVIIR